MTSLLPLLPESPALTVTLSGGGVLPQAPGAAGLDFAGLLDAVAAPPPETAPGAAQVPAPAAAPAVAVPRPGTLSASVVAGWPGGKNLPEPGASLPPTLPLSVPPMPAQLDGPDPLTGLDVAPLTETPALSAEASAPEAASPAPVQPHLAASEMTDAALPASRDRTDAALLPDVPAIAPTPLEGAAHLPVEAPEEIRAEASDQPEDLAPAPPPTGAIMAQPVAALPLPLVANAPASTPAPAPSTLARAGERLTPAAAPPKAGALRSPAARLLSPGPVAAPDTGPASGATSPALPEVAQNPARLAVPAPAAVVAGIGAEAAETEPAPSPATAPAGALVAADGADLAAASPSAAAGPSAAANIAQSPAASAAALPPASAPAVPLAERPADTRPPEARPQLESTIAQVGDIREALRAARPAMTLQHAEFGMVSLRLEQAAPDQWRAVLASRDPGFVPAVQAALETRTIAASGETATGFAGQQGASQNDRYGASPNGGQGSSQPYFGQSGQRDGEAAPDHRRPSTTAALAARGEGEAEDAAAFAPGSGGLFA